MIYEPNFQANAAQIQEWNQVNPGSIRLTQIDGYLPSVDGEISPIVGFVREDGSFAHPFPDDLEKTIAHIERLKTN